MMAGLLLVFHSFAQASEDMLDRRSYAVQITEANKPGNNTDTLSFNNGQFEAASYAGRGYAKADYKATVTNGVITFSAVATNKEGGVANWSGVIQAKHIIGKLSLVEVDKEKKENISTEFAFQGDGR